MVRSFYCRCHRCSVDALVTHPPLPPALQLTREHPDFISIGRLTGSVGWAAVVMLGLETHMVASTFSSSSLQPIRASIETMEHDPFPAAPWATAAEAKRNKTFYNSHRRTITFPSPYLPPPSPPIRSSRLGSRFCCRDAGNDKGCEKYVCSRRCSVRSGTAESRRQMHRVHVTRASLA